MNLFLSIICLWIFLQPDISLFLSSVCESSVKPGRFTQKRAATPPTAALPKWNFAARDRFDETRHCSTISHWKAGAQPESMIL